MRARHARSSTSRPGRLPTLNRPNRMSAGDARTTDYDSIADRFDRRYHLYRYDGVRATLVDFLTPRVQAALEVGCGTGHWLAELAGNAALMAGIDPSIQMLRNAREKRALPLSRAHASAKGTDR